MNIKQFGTTGKNVCEIGLGTYGHGEAYGGISREESDDLICWTAANTPKGAKILVDTAPRYGLGSVEEWIGNSLKNLGRNRLLITTKGGRHIDNGRVNEKDFSADFLRADLERSLKRLKFEEILSI